VQKAALGVLPGLAPLQHEALWPAFLGCLLRLLRPTHLQPGVEEAWEAGGKPSARDLKRWANSSLLMECVLHLIVDAFRWGVLLLLHLQAGGWIPDMGVECSKPAMGLGNWWWGGGGGMATLLLHVSWRKTCRCERVWVTFYVAVPCVS